VAVHLRAGAGRSVSIEADDLDGRAVILIRSDATSHRGALTLEDGESIALAAETALAERIPLVAILSTSGAEVREGVATLHGWGKAARAMVKCSGVIPVSIVLTGPALSGPALLLGLADLVAMTENAYAYVTGPDMVRQFTGVSMSTAELGGAASHAGKSGVAALVDIDEASATQQLSAALSYLPDNADELPAHIPTDDPVTRPTPELRELVPAAANASYDIRKVVASVVDDGELVELRDRFAPNLVTAFASVAGQPIGIIANQPQALAGTLDILSSQKGARFVDLCDSFGLPLVTLVDTSGFFPGKDLEWRGMIRKGAQLAFAYAQATVPRVCVILRKSYGGAYIVMDSKRMGSDVVLAWPSAEIAVMGAKQAVEILHRRLSPEEQAQKAVEYQEELLNPYVAAERGFVDEVIDPAETRTAVAQALSQLAYKRETIPGRKHSNTPL
jgi:acetyl-CoA carboxylase carboxyltransferase component